MSSAEQEAATDALVQDLEDRREMKGLSVRNVPLESVRDAQATLQSIEKEVRVHFLATYTLVDTIFQLHTLYARTGTEVLLMGVRSSTESYLRPFIAYTTERVPDFFNTSMKQTLTDIGL
jgi:hypothetical protein